MEIIKAIILLLAFISFLYFTGKTLYHGFNMINNVTGKYASFFAPLILFMPSQFNEEGNKHRVKFYSSIIGVAISWAIYFLTEGNINA